MDIFIAINIMIWGFVISMQLRDIVKELKYKNTLEEEKINFLKQREKGKIIYQDTSWLSDKE